MGEFLSVERRGKIAILTMIKPESMNAIGTHEDCQDIIDTLRTLGDDRGVSAIILTGSGKAFSARWEPEGHAGPQPASGCSTSPIRRAPTTARAYRR